jgi:hypothetical protein
MFVLYTPRKTKLDYINGKTFRVNLRGCTMKAKGQSYLADRKEIKDGSCGQG